MYACAMHIYVLDPYTCDHDAHTYHTNVWCIYPGCLIPIQACMMRISMFLDPWLWCLISVILGPDPEACMYVWCIYLCFSILDFDFDFDSWYTWLWCTYVWCIYPWCMYPWCMYPWYMYPCSLILIHACMMQISILIPDTCDYDALYMKHLSMMLDPDICIFVGSNWFNKIFSPKK